MPLERLGTPIDKTGVNVALELSRQVDPNIEPRDITPLQGGYNSQAYKIGRGEHPFVLLVERQGAIHPANYGHIYATLKLLQGRQYAHAPQPLWLKEDHRALAMSFFDGVASNEFNFKGNGVDQERFSINVMDALVDLGEISREEYERSASECGIEPAPIETPDQHAKKYGADWFETVKRSCPDNELVAWLAPRVERSVATAHEMEMENRPPLFMFGDPSDPNILIKSDGSFTLIDWETACFRRFGPEFFVSYTARLNSVMRPHREALCAHAAERLGVPGQEFSRRVFEFGRYNGVFDVNWTAMMMARINAGELPGDIDRFRTIARERMAVYEADFERNS